MTLVYGISYPSGVNDVSGPLRAAAGAAPDLILEVGHPAKVCGRFSRPSS